MDLIPRHGGGGISHPHGAAYRVRVLGHYVANPPRADLASRRNVRFDIFASVGRIDGNDGTLERFALEEVVRRNDAKEAGGIVGVDDGCSLEVVR